MIYILHPSQGGYIKIGCSNTPQIRATQIGSIYPYGVEILATYDGSYIVESVLHAFFAPLRAAGVDWFKPTKEIWRFIIENDQALPSFVLDVVEATEFEDFRNVLISYYGSKENAASALGYAPSTSFGDFTNSKISKARHAVNVALHEKRVPDYILEMHLTDRPDMFGEAV